MRSIRATRATEWLRMRAEYKVMGWSFELPNPLQHCSDDTTRRYYAEKQCEDELQARVRCIDKYIAGTYE